MSPFAVSASLNEVEGKIGPPLRRAGEPRETSPGAHLWTDEYSGATYYYEGDDS